MKYKLGVEENIGLSNYKSPLKPAEDGYGADGVQEMHKSGIEIMCKMCGEFKRSLTSHLGHKHNTNAKEYRNKFNLDSGVALVGEKTRQKFIKQGLERTNPNWEEALRKFRNDPKNKEKYSKFVKGRRATLAERNKKGTCPDQILDKIVRVADKLGHSPTKIEFSSIPLEEREISLTTINYYYGSWNNALELAGLDKRRSLGTHSKKHTKESLLKRLKIFYENHNRLPGYSDATRGLIPSMKIYKDNFGSIYKAAKLIGYDHLEL